MDIQDDFWITIIVLLVLVVVLTLAFVFVRNHLRSCAKRVGKVVAGVEVEFDSFWFPRCRTPRLEVHGLTIFNPVGDYRSEYALKLETLIIDIDLWGWLSSSGGLLHINTLILHDLDLKLEFNLRDGGSNLQDILDHVDAHQGDHHDEEEGNHGSPTSSHQHLLTTNPYAKGAVHEHGVTWHPKCNCFRSFNKDSEVKLHYLEVKSIGGSLRHKHSGIGAPFVLADLQIDDFAAKTGAKGVASVVRIILQTLIVTVLQKAPMALLSSASRGCYCISPGGAEEETTQSASLGSKFCSKKGRWFSPEASS